MKTNFHLFLSITALILVSCNGNQNQPIEEVVVTDSLLIVEKTDSLVQEEVIIKEVSKDPEIQEVQEEIVKKYGEQWDFCTCIVKSDSVNTALMEAPDDMFDLVMERSEYIDSKCKGLLIQPNATPEERTTHEKRVKKCLRDNK
ncbi:MAG: hypothetical protein P8O07_01565 [Crocinitomicaceae bacterium]|nr:hypothetical protein [Crocinitomicaceae bacterium]